MTKQKILVIGTGGTIGAKAGSTITADAPLKILNLYTPPAVVDLIGRAAFDRFSEHADLAYLEQLCTYMQWIDYSAYRGVVLLHGSDTLTYTAALLAHLLPDKPLVLVAAGTPPEAPGSNALPNLDLAVQYLLSGAKDGVQIAYDGLHSGLGYHRGGLQRSVPPRIGALCAGPGPGVPPAPHFANHAPPGHRLRCL